jgi:predicted Rossmann fold flavoprotein
MNPDSRSPYTADIAVIGAGAAGLFAAIWSARSSPRGTRIIALDGARTLGAKILVAGGGRCNVTHHEVDVQQYAGSSRNAIRRVLGRFDVPETVRFFREMGVELKREETGKLFPVSDSARDVLGALTAGVQRAGARVVHPWRVGGVEEVDGAFVISRDTSWPHPPDASFAHTQVRARRVILAAGGMALPRTGSDGAGYVFARALGHETTARIFPALVPLTLAGGHWITTLSGITLPATIELRTHTGKRLESFTNSTLCTHFGLSGPGVLDISRYYSAAVAAAGPGQRPVLVIDWLPSLDETAIDSVLRDAGAQTLLRVLQNLPLPERLARALAAVCNADAGGVCARLARETRRALVAAIKNTPLPVTGDRGFTYAEVTAGGVPLSQIRLETMESRVRPGLYLCGEVCDVDGRVGGFNFQWAWASGYVAGCAAAQSLAEGAGE